MPPAKHILCVAEDPVVRETKRLVLESVGFKVEAIFGMKEASIAAARRRFDLVILGRSVTYENKLALAKFVRSTMPVVPILEMCEASNVVKGAEHVLHSHNPEDLAEMVKAILQTSAPRP